jgi:hypothetical protein
VQTLLRMVVTTRETQETENKRRLAWEQEQEKKMAQQQSEMEREMMVLKEEVAALKAIISTQQQGPSHLHGESTNLPSPASTGVASQVAMGTDEVVSEPLSPSLTSDLAQSHSEISSRKRQIRSQSSPTTPVQTSRSNTASPTPDTRPIKRANHHDTRCLTIHQAMRLHLLLMMSLTKNSALPPSHPEGLAIGPHEPIRFVWDKTTKQSVHNARMKTRVLSDIKSRRGDLYPLVAAKDWSKRSLDAVFDQAFVTLRQRFKTQQERQDMKGSSEDMAGAAVRPTEDSKTVKVRRQSRKRTVRLVHPPTTRVVTLPQKLNNRVEARKRVNSFDHVTFDNAFHLECLSSEESDQEQIPSSSGCSSALTLTIHPLPWRSARLIAFYALLDAQHLAHAQSQPKRGVGRKARIVGSPRAEDRMPPRGVRRWMVSKRWWTEMETRVGDLESLLEGPKENEVMIDWQALELGSESEEDGQRGDTEDENDEEDFVPGIHEGQAVIGSGQGLSHGQAYGDPRFAAAHFGSCSSSLHNALSGLF